VFPGKIYWVGEGRARGANNDHFARNGFEVSAEMDAALERDDRVLCGFNAQYAHHVLVSSLAFVTREEHRDPGRVDTA